MLSTLTVSYPIIRTLCNRVKGAFFCVVYTIQRHNFPLDMCPLSNIFHNTYYANESVSVLYIQHMLMKLVYIHLGVMRKLHGFWLYIRSWTGVDR